MELNKKWTAVITAILTILAVLGGGEITDTIDINIGEETEDITCPEIICPERNCQNYSIAYVNNCETGEIDKYACTGLDHCEITRKILSRLG